ncbi:hypothetical protein C1N74_11595 [Microbacterium sp. SGAir0570]|uniref:HIRAN domain-containing protein n=1 Tax=Microbacterium sp. SGAir0570 TaxID=2070348 RepID=UPI0010CCD7E2|nr:HIRAN domain-containing protein [Microbacterium sp. SGAir0570]QCR40990.1 hypothetical protein C1N74_11595 [Microbacterium sp. SGAir0570]
MNLPLHDTTFEAINSVDRSLLLVWQNPSTRRFVPVAELTHLADGRFSFKYLPAATETDGFYALVEYPDLRKTYLSDTLPVFFANRVMSPDRYNYRQYLGWLGLADAEPDTIPVEVLARTGGGRATDTFHIVDRPLRRDASFMSRFFVSGLRHVIPAGDDLSFVAEGDQLELRAQPDNDANPKAVIVDAANGRQLGWVPDWLCGEVSELMLDGWELSLAAERVNPEAPAHTRLLCKLMGKSPRVGQPS